MGTAFNVDRFKSLLKLSISRLIYLQKKFTAQSLVSRKEIAELLRAGKTDQAFTKVRYIVRDDFMVEAMEFVQSFCDDLLKSANLIANSALCDEFILEQVRSIIYASDRMDVPELLKVRENLISKFGPSIVPHDEQGVYPRLVLKLSMSNPERRLCEQYLEAIAASFDVDWEAAGSVNDASSSASEALGRSDDEEKEPLTSSLDSVQSKSPDHSRGSLNGSSSFESPPPYDEFPPKSPPLPMDYSKQSKSTSTPTPTKNVPDFDELTKRFEALRKK